MKIIYELNPQPSTVKFKPYLYKIDLVYQNNKWRELCYEPNIDRPVENRKVKTEDVKKFFKRFGIKRFWKVDQKVLFE